MAGIAANSYADALFSLAQEEGNLDLIKEQLCFVDAQMQENKAFLDLMTHPKLHKEEKKKTLESVFAQQLEITVLRFLKLLTDKGRFHDLHAITTEFIRLYRVEKQIVVADVKSAKALDEDEIKRIQTMLEQKLNQSVEMRLRVDPDLLAGIQIKINDVVLDYTAWNKMEHLKRLASMAETQGRKVRVNANEFKSGRNQ